MSNSTGQTASTRLGEIDVLRGLAALAVVVFHFTGHLHRYMTDFPFDFQLGHYGVQMFFVISGFFIFMTVEKCRNAREFLALRFSRLYPVYWATLAAWMAYEVLIAHQHPWLRAYFWNATMLQAFVGEGDIDIVFWSLAVEMTFYGLMALLMVTGAIRHAVAVTVLWLFVANLWPLVIDVPAVQFPVIKTLAGVLVYAPYFVGGMVFHLLRKSAWKTPMPGLGVLALCVLTAWNTGGTEIGVVAAVVFVLMGLALSGKLRLLVAAPTLWLGAISYSLYLVHRNVGYVALFKLHALGVDSRISFFIVLAGVLALASAFTFWIERPSLRYLRLWQSRRQALRSANQSTTLAS
ncbi:hypothetical protein RD110_00985 [Rhodoferax koreense]|uniref:Acyltransferase 3 domain-containing protein n=1 Tax=Rhodoferax koreensis TaxID=1842727 RepID=A0A1P8JQF4_9BURK|nr:acyltransferase [Rhodoferax koreense]APW35961.1 hypothetical protein RD110_00985 [Rhodoferax koreense]